MVLSGGQKMRVAFARALYANREVYLLDDVFAQLDQTVADAIFDRAIVSFLKTNNKTTLLVTSNINVFIPLSQLCVTVSVTM